MPDTSFRSRWLARFGLPDQQWQPVAEAALNEQAFSRPAQQLPLLEFLFDELPDRIEKRSDTYAHIAEAFAFCCHQFWQCKSHFPLYAHGYAGYLADFLKNGGATPGSEPDVLADLLLGSNGTSLPAAGGFNPAEPADLASILEGERISKGGDYETFLTETGQTKVDEYQRRLREDESFRKDWERFRSCFPEESAEKFLRRSQIPERNWGRGKGAAFTERQDRFQALFDLFCWKYFLWGMQEGEPLLQKPFVAYTPYDTQLFIPGYLSFDAKRDLDHGKIGKLHRARGIPRQGAGFSEGRLEETARRKQALAADAEARRKGFRGEARYDFIRARLGMPEMDERRIRDLIGKIK